MSARLGHATAHAPQVEHDLHAGCAYCGRVARDLVEDDDDLVCAPGTGCAVRPARPVSTPRVQRRPGVVRTRLPGPAPVVRPVLVHDPETCACGHTHATNEAVWCELVSGRLVAYCPGCKPSPVVSRGGSR